MFLSAKVCLTCFFGLDFLFILWWFHLTSQYHYTKKQKVNPKCIHMVSKSSQIFDQSLNHSYKGMYGKQNLQHPKTMSLIIFAKRRPWVDLAFSRACICLTYSWNPEPQLWLYVQGLVAVTRNLFKNIATDFWLLTPLNWPVGGRCDQQKLKLGILFLLATT